MSDLEFREARLGDVVQRMAGRVDLNLDSLQPAREGLWMADVGGVSREFVVFGEDHAFSDFGEMVSRLAFEHSPEDSYVAVRALDGAMHVAPTGLLLKISGFGGGLYGDIRIAPTTACYECTAELLRHHYAPDDVTPGPSGFAFCTETDHTRLVLTDPCTAS